ncbi:MAG TPA: KH domain-containing protein [Clostridia bacterium]
MVELVEYLIKGLADNHDEIKVTQDGSTIKVELSKDDMGKVIGKQGKIVKAIRTIVRAVGMKEEGVKYTVEILDKTDSAEQN